MLLSLSAQPLLEYRINASRFFSRYAKAFAVSEWRDSVANCHCTQSYIDWVQWHGSGFPYRQSLFCRTVAYPCLDSIQLTDAPECFRSSRRHPDVYVMDFVSRMCHTGRFGDVVIFVQRIVATVSIRLQVTAVSSKVLLRMYAPAVR